MALAVTQAPKRRAELTYRHNVLNGRHGWLRLTPAYSVRLVEQALPESPVAGTVVDPFAGTGTTPLCAVAHGHQAVGLDINPFLVWLGNLKLRRFSRGELTKLSDFAAAAVSDAVNDDADGAPAPPMANLERWWSPADLDFLRRLIHAIRGNRAGAQAARDLLLVAFCRTMIALSNAAFNHQSMSFREAAPAQPRLLAADRRSRQGAQFERDVATVLAGAAHDPGPGQGSVLLRDARAPGDALNEAEMLVTSPPYPNRMSYIRELRPYMYWLGFLESGRQAGELDWQAIGGTWGVATSRVAGWEPGNGAFVPKYLVALLEQIARAGTSGEVLSRYVGKYFEDMWTHLRVAVRALRRGAEFHYIVGNSRFYDVIVPTEEIYRDMLREAGATGVRITTIRKRNSKKELFEFDVAGRAS